MSRVMLLLALAAGCSDSSAPVANVVVELWVVRRDGPTITVGQGGSASIECTVTLEARASGTGSATWTDATLRYFVGESGAPALDSSVVTAAEIASAWGDSTIEASATQVTRWSFTGGVPFTVGFEFGYRPAGAREDRTALAQFACGPQATSDLPPSIQGMQVSTAGVPLEPGGVVTVQFDAMASAGVWQSMARVDGACQVAQVFAEQLQQSVRRIVSLTIPSTCSPGGSLVASAWVRDAALRVATQSAATAIPVVDLTPPSLTPVLWSPYTPGVGTLFAGTFFDGDTLEVEHQASDNHRVEWLIWELSPLGVRDSVRGPASALPARVKIPLQTAQSGDFELTLIARDSVGLESIHRSAPGDLRVLPTIDLPFRADTVAWDVEAVELDQARGRIYLLQTLADRILVLGMPNLQTISTFPLPSGARDLELTPGGDSLLVTIGQQHRSLGIIDLRQAAWQLKELPLAVDHDIQQAPFGMAAMVNGKVLIGLFGSTGPTSSQLLELDLATGAQRIRTDASPSGFLGGRTFVRSADGRRAAVVVGQDIRRYDAATDSFGPQVAGDLGASAAWNSDGSRASMGLNLYDGAFAFLRQVSPPMAGYARATAFSPSGQDFYHAWSHIGIMHSNAEDGSPIGRIRSVTFPDHLRVWPDGSHLFVVEVRGDGRESYLRLYDLP